MEGVLWVHEAELRVAGFLSGSLGTRDTRVTGVEIAVAVVALL